MNKQKFKQIVKNYHELSAQDRIDLHDLVKDNPYSQILHSLVAKANNDAKTDIAKQSLNYAAMYASDRSVLRDIIQSKAVIAVSPESVVKLPEEPVKKIDEISKDQQTLSDGIGVKKKGKVITVDTDQLSHTSDDLIKEVWQDLAALKKSKAAYLAKPDSTLELLPTDDTKPTSARAKSQVKATSSSTKTKPATVKKAKTTTPVKTKTVKSAKSDTTVSTKAPKAVTRTTKKQVPKAQASKTVKPTTASSKTSSSTKAKKAPVKTASKPKTTDSATLTSESKTKKTTTKQRTSSAKKNTTESKKKVVTTKEVDKESQKKIIENFIDKEPRISAKTIKAAETDQKDLSEKSTVYSEDLISENLAQILIAQGKKEKAVEIYKKLIWKFPQKKSYFAAQIEKIKNN